MGGLLADAQKERSGVLSSAFWSDKLMNWAMKDEDSRSSSSGSSIPFRHQNARTGPFSSDGLSRAARCDAAIRHGHGSQGRRNHEEDAVQDHQLQIESMAGRFIAGTDAESALPQIKSLWNQKMAFSVDLLGGMCQRRGGAAYQARYMDLVEHLPGGGGMAGESRA